VLVVFKVNEQHDETEGTDQHDPAVSHDRFVSAMDEPGEGVRLDTARCLGFLSDGTLGKIPFLIHNIVGWLFHFVCWGTLVYLFIWDWVLGVLGIFGYLMAFFFKTMSLEHCFAVNLTLAKAKREPEFYRQLCAEDILEVKSAAET